MITNRLNDKYFNWLFGLVCGNRYSSQISYKKLLTYLHNTEFRCLIPRDENRAEDGIALRYRFALDSEYNEPEIVADAITGPCSVLEMMLALAIRCEETIMDDARVGDRTGQWFWGMIVNLGLGAMHDVKFDRDVVEHVVSRFLDRKYEPDGKGGLFTVKYCDRDLRDVEIWHQMCWYLDNIT